MRLFASYARCRLLLFCAFASIFINNVNAQHPSAVLQQAKNGTVSNPISPVEWIRGGINPTNNHKKRGLIIPYRLVLDNLQINNHYLVRVSATIETSNKYSIDFLTSYDVPVSHQDAFGHEEEIINPLYGLTGNFTGPQQAYFPSPLTQGGIQNYPVMNANAVNTTINLQFLQQYGPQGPSVWNGEIEYATFFKFERGKMYFEFKLIPDNSKVIIAWGAHIADDVDYGTETAGNGIMQVVSLLEINPEPILFSNIEFISSGGSDGGGQACAFLVDGGRPINPIGEPVDITAVEELSQVLPVYPNPVRSGSFIQIPASFGFADLEIFSGDGSKITILKNKSGRINLPFLPAGVYYIRFKSLTNGSIRMERIVVIN